MRQEEFYAASCVAGDGDVVEEHARDGCVWSVGLEVDTFGTNNFLSKLKNDFSKLKNDFSKLKNAS